ncbi:HyaD/HybD family hydrogenase maturation endopeptidase [Azoarcus sp. KH32C]|uniref:HyaD/HybD family hydrogenase maturation endopeptidase n=1 Tax=Azoarcus sp. KH32C TaxID=748247 RepID=UPI0002386F2C|nr:HyaD/HybD family hydrogenase maturation endopeptidase [Azoarcus sp. KH32C]BAL26083.1 hydrogenase expression/formation protein [Azoarcus sp. KH32C]
MSQIDTPIRRAVLLGVGNILLTDEGVGVRLVEELQAGYEIPEVLEVIDGGTAAMELLEDLENLDLLVIADCVRVGQPPASVVVLKDDEVPAFFRARISPHQVGLSDVLATLEITERAPRHVVVVGVQPVDISTSMEQTAPVRAAMPVALQAIRDALAEYGLQTPAKALAEAA